MAFTDALRPTHTAAQRPGVIRAEALRHGTAPSDDSRTTFRSVRLATIAASSGVGHMMAGWPGAAAGIVLAVIAAVMLSPLFPDRRIMTSATGSPHAPRAGYRR